MDWKESGKKSEKHIEKLSARMKKIQVINHRSRSVSHSIL
jgi:hypothetical protein